MAKYGVAVKELLKTDAYSAYIKLPDDIVISK